MTDRVVALRLPHDACQRLSARASAAGCSVSEYVRRLSDAVPGQPDLIASAERNGQPVVVWSDGPMGGVWPQASPAEP